MCQKTLPHTKCAYTWEGMEGNFGCANSNPNGCGVGFDLARIDKQRPFRPAAQIIVNTVLPVHVYWGGGSTVWCRTARAHLAAGLDDQSTRFEVQLQVEALFAPYIGIEVCMHCHAC
jgi:hypothetical protein